MVSIFFVRISYILVKIYKLNFIQGISRVIPCDLQNENQLETLANSHLFCYTCPTLKGSWNLTCKMLSFVKAQTLLRVRHPWQTLGKISYPCGYFHNEKNKWIYYILCLSDAKYYCKAYDKLKIWKGRTSSKLLPQPLPYLLYILSIDSLAF